MKDNPERRFRLTTVLNVAGQLAVVLSLLYVGYEIKLNTRVARAQAHQDLVGLIISFGDPVVNKIDDVASLRARADSGVAKLSASERMEFMTYSNRLMSLFELAYDEKEDRLLGDDVWAGVRGSLTSHLRRPGFREYWERDKEVFGPKFAAFVDSLNAATSKDR